MFILICLHDSKFKIDHKGGFQRGYIHFYHELGFQFAVQRNARSRKIYFTVPLIDFKQNSTTLVGVNIIFPRHSTVRSFF